MLLDLEAVEHRKGWDQSPVLGAMIKRPGVIAVAKVFGGTMPSGHPPTTIAAAAKHLLDDPEHAQRVVKRLPGLYGVVLVCEGWKAPPGMTLEQRNELRTRGLALPDVPGSVEVRNVTTVSLDREIWYIERARGQQPKLFRSGDDGLEVDGMITGALKGLLGVLAAHLPGGKPYLDWLINVEAPRAQAAHGATRPNSSNAE